MVDLPEIPPVTKVPEFVLRHRWSPDEDTKLREHVELYGRMAKHELKSHPTLKHRTPEACQIRWRYLKQSGKRARHAGRKWTPTEMTQLKQAVDNWILERGGWKRFVESQERISWVFIASKVDGRTQKQCREKWTNFCDPRFSRAPWTQEHLKLLLLLEKTYSNSSTKWKDISTHLNRSPDCCKNQYHVLRKKPFSDLFR